MDTQFKEWDKVRFKTKWEFEKENTKKRENVFDCWIFNFNNRNMSHLYWVEAEIDEIWNIWMVELKNIKTDWKTHWSYSIHMLKKLEKWLINLWKNFTIMIDDKYVKVGDWEEKSSNCDKYVRIRNRTLLNSEIKQLFDTHHLYPKSKEMWNQDEQFEEWDKVLVKEQDYKSRTERIFINFDKSWKALCVDFSDEEEYEIGNDYKVISWKHIKKKENKIDFSKYIWHDKVHIYIKGVQWILKSLWGWFLSYTPNEYPLNNKIDYDETTPDKLSPWDVILEKNQMENFHPDDMDFEIFLWKDDEWDYECQTMCYNEESEIESIETDNISADTPVYKFFIK